MQHLLLQQSSLTLHTSPTCLHFCKDFKIGPTLRLRSRLRSCLLPYSSKRYAKQIDCNKKFWRLNQLGYLLYKNIIYIPLRSMIAAEIQFIAIVAIIKNTICVFSIVNLIYPLLQWSSFWALIFLEFLMMSSKVILFFINSTNDAKRLAWHIAKHYITIILFHIHCILYIGYR